MILYRLLYIAFIRVYKILIGIAALWNPKARLWKAGRKNILHRLGSDLNSEKSEIIWMHCASLGEFEQGRPLLEKLKRVYPRYKTLLTFFSPSGYNAINNTTIADFIYYLPFGKRTVASDFVTLVHPKLVLWVKYDYWYYFIDELRKRKIPLLLISANFRKDQIFFRWYGKLHRQMLHCFSHLFVQTDYSKNLLSKIGFSQQITISGDTRFDRVVEIASRFKPLKDIETFCGEYKVIVAGSTWSEDAEELDHFANSNPEIKFIIAPHEIDELHMKDIERLFKRTIRYSEMQLQMADGRWMMAGDHSDSETPTPTTPNVLIIDNIGMLSRLYKYATITYVGGGFGQDGVHNVLEAAVYGKPVIFGPVFNKYIEAIELLEEGGAYTIENALELEDILKQLLSDHQLYMTVCRAAKNYVMTKKGATEKIIQYIQENRLLTN
jgi:3-deoxy-D-manno-octulosonic-acid transferase